MGVLNKDTSKLNKSKSSVTRAFRNTRYTVMIYENHPTTHGNAIRVMVQKHNDTAILNHWSEMQKISDNR